MTIGRKNTKIDFNSYLLSHMNHNLIDHTNFDANSNEGNLSISFIIHSSKHFMHLASIPAIKRADRG